MTIVDDTRTDSSTDTTADTSTDAGRINAIGDDGSDGSPGSGAPEAQPLDALLDLTAAAPGDVPAMVTAQVVTSDGEDIVLIGRSSGSTASAGGGAGGGASGTGTVDVVTGAGVLTQRDRYATAVPVADPDRRERVLRRTLSRFTDRYREVQDALETQRRSVATTAGVLDRIRVYLIDWYKDEDLITRGNLDDFLDEFGLPAYRPKVRVEYQITGSYIVEDSTTDAARADADDYLRPDLSHLDRVEEGSSDYSVSVDEVDDDDSY